MKRGRLRDIYLVVRRWTDADLSRLSIRNKSLAPTYAVLLLAVLIGANTTGAARLIGWSVTLPLAFVWTAFVVWRGGRVIRAGSIKSARQYDQRGKFDLPPEYAASESHLAHHRREMKRVGRSTR